MLCFYQGRVLAFSEVISLMVMRAALLAFVFNERMVTGNPYHSPVLVLILISAGIGRSFSKLPATARATLSRSSSGI